MIPLSIPLAVAFIVTPDLTEVPISAIAPSSLQTVALALEVIDPRECRYIFASDDGISVTADLVTVRRRYADLRDAPPLCDSARFPSVETCREMKKVNQAYRSWLDQRKELFPLQEWVDEAISETNWAFWVWDAAQDAVFDGYQVDMRRRAMKNLRERIGEWNYYAGCLPPPVPVWRFRRAE